MTAGGDFFEVQLESSRYKARPPTIDNGDGTYSVSLRLPGDAYFAGHFTLSVELLWTRYGGLTLSHAYKNDRFWKNGKSKSLSVASAEAGCPGQKEAGAAPTPDVWTPCADTFPFTAPDWSGHWLKLPTGKCAAPYCTGDVRALAGADGWVYRLPSCYFHVPSNNDARACFGDRWLHMVGDSNHQDTARNLFADFLGTPVLSKGQEMPRTYDVSRSFDRASGKGKATARVSNLFNGAPAMLGNNVGLDTFKDGGWLAKLRAPFANRAKLPDAVVFNSGLHDALHRHGKWFSLTGFAESLDGALEVLLADNMLGAAPPQSPPPPGEVGRPPLAVWRNTVVPAGGTNRRLPLNPQKVAVQNNVTTTRLQEGGSRRWLIVDAYDVTWAWHWDNKHSDGGHYGCVEGGGRGLTDAPCRAYLLSPPTTTTPCAVDRPGSAPSPAKS